MNEVLAPPALIRGVLQVPQSVARAQAPRQLEAWLEAQALLPLTADDRRWHIDGETGAWVLAYTVRAPMAEEVRGGA